MRYFTALLLFVLLTSISNAQTASSRKILGSFVFEGNAYNYEFRNSSMHALLQPYLNTFLKTNGEDRLFFRYRWTFEHTEKENKFTQIQVGYSMNLFKASEEEK